MREVAVTDGTLAWDVLELVPPWLSAPSTVILHHGLGTSADMWSEWLPRLAMHHRVVRFDMRGCGRSSALERAAKLDLELFRDDVLAVADASGAQRFHLIGESFGGTVALFTAATCRDRLLSVTTISSPHRGARMRILDGWQDLPDGPESVRTWSERMMAYRFFDGAVPPEAWNWFQALQDRTDPTLVRGVAQLVRQMDLTPLLRDLDLPVLLVAPDSSPFVEAELVSDLHGILPRSSLQIFAGTRHGLRFVYSRSSIGVATDFMRSDASVFALSRCNRSRARHWIDLLDMVPEVIASSTCISGGLVPGTLAQPFRQIPRGIAGRSSTALHWPAFPRFPMSQSRCIARRYKRDPRRNVMDGVADDNLQAGDVVTPSGKRYDPAVSDYLRRFQVRTISLTVLIAISAAFAAPAVADPGHGRGHGQGNGPGGGNPGQPAAQINIVISPHDRTTVYNYYRTEYIGGHCPPGLAKKNNGCLPPGQAKKMWMIGHPITSTIGPEIAILGVHTIGIDRVADTLMQINQSKAVFARI